MNPLRMFKYTATGNDFLLIDARSSKKNLLVRQRAEMAKKICHRRFGVGADGLVFLDHDKATDFRWDFYNSDGSLAEMCGNAARCVGLHFWRMEEKRQLNFSTLSGVIETALESTNKTPDEISVKMSPIREFKWNQLAKIDSNSIHYDFVVAGVPHAVVMVPNFRDKTRLKTFAKTLKSLPVFGKASTNVTLVKALNKTSAQAMSFERGVENFTLSCGTGAVAAAYAMLKGEANVKVNLEVPGGHLAVIFTKDHPILTGPAQFVASIELSEEFFGGI